MKKINVVLLFNLMIFKFISVQGSYNPSDSVAVANAVPVEDILQGVQADKPITKETLMNKLNLKSLELKLTLENGQLKRSLQIPYYLQSNAAYDYSTTTLKPKQLQADGSLEEGYKSGIVDIMDFVNTKATLKDGPICIHPSELPAIVKVIEDEALQKGFKDGLQKGTTGGLFMGTILGAGIVGTCWLTSKLLDKKK